MTVGFKLFKLIDPSTSWFYYKFWGFMGAITLFFLARIFQILGYVYSRRQQERKIILALYTEISLNVKGMKKYNLSSAEALEYSHRIASFTPVLIMSGHDDLLMRGHVSELGLLPPSIVQRVSAFYARMREADDAVLAINSEHFNSISMVGRINSVDRVFRATHLAFNLGTLTIKEIRKHYGSSLFCRKCPKSVKWAARAAHIERNAEELWAKSWVRLACSTAVKIRIPEVFRCRSSLFKGLALERIRQFDENKDLKIRIRKGAGSS